MNPTPTITPQAAPAEIDRVTPTIRPDERVVMVQRWSHLLFLHWAVPPEYFEGRIPPELTLDTFDGMAYIGLIPFTMSGIRPPWSPAVPGLSSSHETNLRTYVHREGADPGVWFFSLDASNLPAVLLARSLWKLPYHHSDMSLFQTDDGTVRYRSDRRWPSPLPAAHDITATPFGEPWSSQPGTLEHFLLERYILYATKDRQLYRGQVNHLPYPAQRADLVELEESHLQASGFARPSNAPLAHYASGVDVEVFPLHKVR